MGASTVLAPLHVLCLACARTPCGLCQCLWVHGVASHPYGVDSGSQPFPAQPTNNRESHMLDGG